MKSEKINIAILLGTKRTGRRSENAARLVEKIGKEFPEIETKFVDPLDFEFPLDGNNAETRNDEYAKITEWADAFFIVTPEYNHGYPSTLKRMLDSEYKNYFYKPVVMAGVSIGAFGGARCIEAILGTLRELHMYTIPNDVNFIRVQEVFSDKGELLQPYYIDRIKLSYKELIWATKTLKYGRENILR